MPLRLLPVLLAAASLLTPGLDAQEAVVRAGENLRAEPNGTILGRLEAGTGMRVQQRDGNWTRVVLEGYVWERSLQIQREGGFDLVVAVDGGENLREEPQGRVAARLDRGTRLQELERVPGWIRVRRVAWVWSPSLDFRDQAGAPAEARPPGVTGRDGVRDASPADAPSPARDRWVRTPAEAPAILSAPDGDTLGRAEGGTELRVLAREGNWARVQLEGWVWLPGADPAMEVDVPVIEGLHPRDLMQDPDRYRGRVVELEVQFISVERAERVRTDFYEGEPYLLTRSVDGERTFVYVAIPRDGLEELSRFTPLERLRVVGRVRSGASGLTGNPILDLMEVSRAGR
jgi:hypothetical protein